MSGLYALQSWYAFIVVYRKTKNVADVASVSRSSADFQKLLKQNYTLLLNKTNVYIVFIGQSFVFILLLVI